MPYERKIINDPVFGFINIPKGLLYDIVRHPLLQRLTRIKQVGLSSVVYPGAQHTRFQHSLGAFYLMSEAITQLTSKGNFIFDSEAEAVQAAMDKMVSGEWDVFQQDVYDVDGNLVPAATFTDDYLYSGMTDLLVKGVVAK